MKYVFGPVPSRRLGQSLGIDTIPLKTCNWNCVYCQLGRTQPVINERREYVPTEEILTEVQEALAVHKLGDIDWVTFVGSGEPLLHASMGYLIQQVKNMTDLPVAVILVVFTRSAAGIGRRGRGSANSGCWHQSTLPQDQSPASRA